MDKAAPAPDQTSGARDAEEGRLVLVMDVAQPETSMRGHRRRQAGAAWSIGIGVAGPRVGGPASRLFRVCSRDGAPKHPSQAAGARRGWSAGCDARQTEVSEDNHHDGTSYTHHRPAHCRV